MNRCPACGVQIEVRDYPGAVTYGTACSCALRPKLRISEEEITMLGFCACGGRSEVCGCANCDAALMCRSCFFDHREQVHGYVPPEKKVGSEDAEAVKPHPGGKGVAI